METKNANFEKFLSELDTYMETKTRKSKNGRNKANFELKCYWIKPKGGKFTYRSDDTHRKLKEQGIISDKTNELGALQVQFALVRKKIKAAVMYDNSIPFGMDNVIFQYDKGKVVIDELQW